MSDYLPQEVLIKILTRLPPKSLIKFKCVSKSWNSLISSPYFIFLQTHHATTSKPTNLPSNQVLIRHYSETQDREICSVYNDDNEEFSVDKNVRIIEYPFSNNERDYYRIVGSCNGVLCLSEDLIRHTNTSIVLWNPVIRRRVALPKPQHTYNSCVLGFGFDVVSNDYKVVRLAYAKGDDGCVMFPPKVEVYSLRVRSWREIINVEIPHHCNLEYFCAQVFINRNVHWMAFRREEKEIKNFILVFDIGLEVFNEMPLPELLVYELPGNLNAMVIRESLAICQADFHVRSIWIMNKYGDVGSWSKMFNVRLSGVLTICGFRMNGDILLAVMRRGLVSYNLETGASVDLGYLGVQDLFYVGSYVESLALLNEGEEVREQVHSNTKIDESLSESDYSDEDE